MTKKQQKSQENQKPIKKKTVKKKKNKKKRKRYVYLAVNDHGIIFACFGTRQRLKKYFRKRTSLNELRLEVK